MYKRIQGPWSVTGDFNWSFLSPLSPASGEFPFFLGLLDFEFVPTAAIREILISSQCFCLMGEGRKVGLPSRTGKGSISFLVGLISGNLYIYIIILGIPALCPKKGLGKDKINATDSSAYLKRLLCQG